MFAVCMRGVSHVAHVEMTLNSVAVGETVRAPEVHMQDTTLLLRRNATWHALYMGKEQRAQHLHRASLHLSLGHLRVRQRHHDAAQSVLSVCSLDLITLTLLRKPLRPTSAASCSRHAFK